MSILDILLFPAGLSFVATLFFYAGRRENVELSGMDETEFQSYYREWITNYLLTLPILPVIMALDFLIGLIA